MISTVVLILTSLIAPSYQFSSQKFGHGRFSSRIVMSSTSTAIYPSKDTDVLTIKVATVDEFPRCAGFLSSNMYASDIPKAQGRELQRLELVDLRSRYIGAGRQTNPSVFLIAVEEEEIVGSVGLDCQYFDSEKQKFRQIKSNKPADPNRQVICVLSNLAVRRDRRKQKIAQKLLLACENYIKDNENWDFNEIYLQVDSNNSNAQRLYIKQNYKLIFEDNDATCVASGDFNLKTLECTNYCYKKVLSPSKGGGNPFDALSGMFSSLFNKK